MTTGRIDPPSVPPATTTPRRTEETDTRQAILRHDPEFEKRKKKEGEEGGFKDPYEDLADVSVPALKNFLLGLLDKMEPDVPHHPAPSHDAHRQASSPQAAAAMGAYQRRATGAPPPPPPPTTAPAASALDQAALNLDRTELLDLIRELDRLTADGISAIALEKGDGFLASIRAGVNRARNIG